MGAAIDISEWVFDQRGADRAVRVSAHADAGFLIVSTWRSDECVATVRLRPEEAAQLAANIARGLAQLATPVEPEEGDALADRVARLEARVRTLEP